MGELMFLPMGTTKSTQLEKDNIELKARLDELSSKYNVLQANYVHLKGSHEKLVESHIMLEVAHEVVITSVKSSQPLSHTHSFVHHLN